MRYGFISDIHGNIEALEEAFALLTKARVDKIFSAGDIVGYGPNPSECVNLIRINKVKSVIGNHDYAVNDKYEENLFNTYAKEAIQWTRNNLSTDDLAFLKGLPFSLSHDGFVVFHGLLNSTSPFTYVLSDYEAWRCFKNMEAQLGFFGHTHIAGCFIMQTSGKIVHLSGAAHLQIEIEEGKKYLVNVGSVGQPRDGNPESALAIFDSDKMKIEIVRFSYDIEKTYAKILKAGLPSFLGERLFVGA